MAEIYADATNLADSMKEVYTRHVENVKGLRKLTINEFSKGNNKNWRGEGWVETILKTGNRRSIRFGVELEAIPAAGFQAPDQFTVPVRFVAGRIKLTDKAMVAMRGEGSIGKMTALTSEINGVTEDIMDVMEKATWNYGKEVLGIVGATATSTTMTTKAPEYTKNIMPGDLLDTAETHASGASGADANLVISVNRVANTVLLTTSCTTTLDEYIVRAAHWDSGAPTYGFGIMGLQGIVDDGTLVSTFHGVPRTGSTRVDAAVGVVHDNSGTNRAFQQKLLQAAINDVDFNRGGNAEEDSLGGAYKLYAAQGQINAFLDVMWEGRMFTTTDFEAGHKRLTFNGVPITRRFHCPAESWMGVKTDDINFYEAEPLGFLGGYLQSGYLVQVTSYLMGEGYIRWWCNMSSPASNRHFILQDIEEA